MVISGGKDVNFIVKSTKQCRKKNSEISIQTSNQLKIIILVAYYLLLSI